MTRSRLCGAVSHPQLIDRGLGTSTPLELLNDAAAALDQQASLAVQDSEPLRAIVQSLEQQFDGLSTSGPILIAPTEVDSELPSSEDLIADLEQFLREQDSGNAGNDANRDLSLN